MIEENAKTKWCPMARDRDGANRYEGGATFESMNCVASKCAVWVQTDNECEPEDPKELAHRDRETVCVPAGHCGLIK